MWDGQSEMCQAHVLFDSFVQAATCKETLRAFQDLCEELNLNPGGQPQFYHTLRSRLHYWKAKALWAKLDKRACQKEYMRGHACTSTTCLIIGAGPCGLRTAIELGFLGARVVLVEKRDAFSRNNVLHLWPFTIQDLRGLGAKKFYGKFCAGAIDHISIRQLQLMLLKVALLLGVEVHVNVEFKHLLEPPENQEKRVGWRAEVQPSSHPVRQLEFDVVIGADGRRNTLPGFRRKEFRGKLAIAITANFINRNTTAEAKVEEISGVAFIFNQRFFQDLRQATGIDLENIVYYKDDTHYFVMTAKKQSLLEKGVILRDYADTEMLLSRHNVDQNALLSYAREAADFSTNHQLPALDFAINHYGQSDVAMFDFTCMYASENAAMVRQRMGHPLLVALVGDSLLEPFWPMGTGIARGFLAAMDTAWMVRSWGQGNTPLEVLAERESVYRLLPQTTPENVSKNYSQFSVDPASRYPNINMQLINAAQVRHLIDTGEGPVLGLDAVSSPHPRLTRQESMARYSKLLSWCQEHTHGYRKVCVTDFTSSWRSGLALCALIHTFRPDLIDFASLEESEAEFSGQLGLDVAEQEFGICPIMTGKEMSVLEESDSLCMVMYLSQLHELLKDTSPPSGSQSSEERAVLFSSSRSPISLLSKLGQSLSRKRNPKDKKEKEADSVGKRRRTSQAGQSEEEDALHDGNENKSPAETPGSEPKASEGHSKVRSMASLLLAKFEENSPSPSTTAIRRQNYIHMYTGGVSSLALQIANQIQSQQAQAPKLLHRRESGSQKDLPVNVGSSDVCYFCGRRVYVMERLSAEGKFFHRSCFQCDHCSSTIRLSNYTYDQLHGKFYCKHHFSFRLASVAQRKRPAPPVAPRPAQASLAASSASTSLSSLGSVGTATPDSWSSSTHTDMASSLAKRLCGTPERIELENYKPSPQKQDSPLQEVPEETLAQHNLSASLQEKNAEEQSSSSESDLEEEELVWKKGEELHARTNGERKLDLEEELKEEEGGEKLEKQEGEEEGEVSEEEQDEGDSSDEGEYCPWERERLSGVWLEEEEAGFVKESYEGCSDDPDIDVSSLSESKLCDQREQEESVPFHQSPASTESPVSMKPSESDLTPDPSTTPESSPAKRSEVVEEFWMKSAEIRKSLGLTPLSRELQPKHIAASTQTSNVKESFYTSVTYNTAALDSPNQSARICDSSTQTHSVTDLQETSPLGPTDGDAGVDLGRCSVVHRLSITVEGCVMADNQGLDSTSFATESVLNPDAGLPTPPYSPSHSPLVGKQCRALHHSEPILDREVMAFSSTCTASVPQRSSFKSDLEQAQSLPPDEIEILCGDEAEKLPERSCRMESGEVDNRRAEHSRTLPDRVVAPLLAGGPEVRLRRSEMKLWGPDADGDVKEKKRSSLFSPRKSRKNGNAAAESGRETGKHKSLWKTVFSVYKKDKKRKEVAVVAETLPAANNGSKRKVSGINRTTDLCFRKNPSFSEDTDMSCHALLERCPLRAQRAGTEEELNARLTRRVQRAARRQAKQEELRRLHRAQIIQRQLEQVEVKQRQLEEKGVAVEKALRGEAVEPFDGSPRRRPVYLCPCCSSEAKAKGTEHDHSVYVCTVFFLYVVQEPPLHQLRMGKKDDPSLMHQWFKLVQEKNALVRYESELMIFARELELEDRQSRLQQELRERMAVDDHLKGEEELAEERRILSEMLDVVEQRDALVALLEEQRVREKEEDSDLEAVMLSKGFSLHWD
ncbi:protein-methionine sulfoxide oxidase mical3b isoform X5 [Danio rerio]|uniref:F-actin monooxygenase n=1 Tax=Danio rerio TaxID=7955 RepID=A0A8M9Q0Z6_DANRE|nr:protein-methionine sulfoxide oxidase mical3b isoform X1 [Danio rerio]XP_021330889.1 protein-methionine sulfoxide oxidase mical3b isoform X1 [Danio rerio]|eukprot:XP_017210768.1 protein-methionine sulfoxide oxidase mical3b isoform X1 [Danio rerio]